jgi:FKBP-type peptidyl-prolyl cis-trans isomerase FkpA
MMRGRFWISLYAAIAIASLAACGSSDSSTTAPTTTSSAAYSQSDLVAGTGVTAATGSDVIVAYTGWLYDNTKTDGKGTQFDSRSAFRFTVGAGGVIAGWDRGVVGMRVAGTRRLIIPPELAYGTTSPSALIPANATLVFDITLLNVIVPAS